MKTLLVLAATFLVFDETKKADVVCPLDGTKFTATEVVRTDADWGWGGVDGDFCRHAFKTLPMEMLTWTCPKCFYSGSKPAFDPKAPLSDDDKKKLTGNIKPAIQVKAGAKQDDIPGYVKYDLAAQVAILLGKPAQEIGKKLLHAAWAVRQAGPVWLDNFDEWQEVRTSLNFEKPPMDLGKENRTDMELKICKRLEKDAAAYKGAESTQKLLTRYCLAYTLRKHGENVRALKWMDEIAKSKGFNSIVDDAVAKMRASIVLERTYQAKAAESYKKAVEDAALAPGAKSECLYQLGEIARRNGDTTAATDWFKKAEETTPDEKLKKIIETQRELMKD